MSREIIGDQCYVVRSSLITSTAPTSSSTRNRFRLKKSNCFSFSSPPFPPSSSSVLLSYTSLLSLVCSRCFCLTRSISSSVSDPDSSYVGGLSSTIATSSRS
uniref:(northern house mosquito) hypothetical protein n=1 Tax=Culex pipiens TaxID=7175 RepID=A0A8D8BVT5_CULPI